MDTSSNNQKRKYCVDGNCGFQAVSFDVYQDQGKWIQVLQTYLKYKDSLYKAMDE